MDSQKDYPIVNIEELATVIHQAWYGFNPMAGDTNPETVAAQAVAKWLRENS